MKRFFVVCCTIMVLVMVVYLGASWYFASQIIIYESVPIDDAVATAPNESESRKSGDDSRWQLPFLVPNQETVELIVNDVMLVLDYYANGADADCAVIYLHGFSNDRSSVGVYGSIFYDLGCDILAYDSRSHGDSGDGFMTYGYHERYEAVAMVEWLMEHTGIERSQIGLVGISYGAVTALQSLIIDPELAFVIADSPHQDMRTLVVEQATAIFGDWITVIEWGAFTIGELRADFDVDAVSSVKAVQGVDTPILILHSLTDSWILPRHSEAIFAVANPDTTRLILQDYGSPHGESILDNPDAVRQDIYAFLDEYRPDYGNLQMVMNTP